MGNLYTDNLIGTVIGLSVADDWEGARREWEIVGCEVDETHSATCVCGKEGLRYVYTIVNTETGETLSPIGSSCIKKFEQSDMDEELAGWQQAIKAVVTQECSEGSGRVFDGIDFVFADDGNPRCRHLGFLVSGQAGNPAEKAWEAFSIKPCADGSIRFTDETIQSCVCTWWSWKEFLKEGKITREEYENRKDSFLR